jgi:glycerophosphoryl diester phosphodiesterase
MPLELQHTVVRQNARLGGVDVVHCPLDLLTDDLIASLHADGRLVHAADCNTRSHLERAFALGVDQLSTDHVDLALSLRG